MVVKNYICLHKLSMREFWRKIFSTIKQKRGTFIILLILTIIMLMLGVISGRHLDNGIITIDLSQQPFIKFISHSGGFVSLIFNSLISLAILYFIICVGFIKPFSSLVSIIFYVYFVYSQGVIFINVLLVYGFFNALILLILLLMYIFCLLSLFILLILELLSICNTSPYFKICFNPKQSNIFWLGLIIACVVLVFSFVLLFMRSYIFLLIY